VPKVTFFWTYTLFCGYFPINNFPVRIDIIAGGVLVVPSLQRA